MSNLQLEMNFGAPPAGNRLRDGMNNGDFFILVETDSPGRDSDPEAAGDKLAALEEAVMKLPDINAALAITDGASYNQAWRAAEFISRLSPENRDRHLIYFSGKNTDFAEFQSLSGMAGGNGFRNFCAVSGDAPRGASARDVRKSCYTESTAMLDYWHNCGDRNIFSGGVTNPFQYSAYSLMSQYAKMIKKINLGGSFIVTQIGWDMLKLQNLRWYLNLRNIFVPTIARLVLLTPERAEKITAGNLPGVNIPPDFRRILEQELQFSLNQFEAAQWRRLELQAAGCRLLGYSAIQISGLDNVNKLHIAAERINSALHEFTDFNFWLDQYTSYMSQAEMAPFSGSFYLFDRSLSRKYPDCEPKMRELGEPQVSGGEKFRYSLREFLFPNADRQSADTRRLLKNIFCGCRNCSECRLVQCKFICPEQCPKGLANGPCGGIKTDGSCEISGIGECVHRRIMRLAHWCGEEHTLEDDLINQG